MEVLGSMQQLRESGFGRPRPRHGLRLLYWFADRCVSEVDGELLLMCDPTSGVFGFHRFENWADEQNKKLLPPEKCPYYLVGNLNSPGAEKLPFDVREDAGRPDGNTDRIIVCSNGKPRFGKVYATTHKNQSVFEPNATFHVTRDLLKTIKSFSTLDAFLENVESKSRCGDKPVYMMAMMADSSRAEAERPVRPRANTHKASPGCCAIL